MENIFLYGPPGSGKTTIANELSGILGRPFVDIDLEIEKEYSRSISNIIQNDGEAAFREYESLIIAKFSTSEKRQIIALGGGALLRDQNRKVCEDSGTIIFLDVTNEIMAARILGDNTQRPLLSGELEQKINHLMSARNQHYDSFNMRVATYVTVNSDNNNFDEITNRQTEDICRDILIALNIYPVSGMGASYNVYVRSGELNKLGILLHEKHLSKNTLVVMDDHLEKIYSSKITSILSESGFSSKIIVIPSGEENKTLSTISFLWKEFLASGLDRQSTVIAFGGGVVCDLTGFAASTFMRGCNWCAIPTSLLAMVDASIGGKTGFDTEEGKNLIGSFYPPKFVLVDPELLKSLPEIEFVSGMAEIVKHGVINDPDLFTLCSYGPDYIKNNIEEIISKAIKVKVNTIVIDPFEKGIRASLNLGHTIGHAVEIASHYQIKHGEAVAIGMVLEAHLAEKIGVSPAENNIADQISTVLEKIGLPIRIPSYIPKSEILAAVKVDKKKENGTVRFSLPVKIGEVALNISINNLETIL